MKIEKTFRLKQPVEKAWAFLSDPRKVATCVPGAQITEQLDENNYQGTISFRVGPSVTDYKGELEIVNLDAANHKVEIFGKGQDVRGRGGSASMRMTIELKPLADGGTAVNGVSNLTVVGMLAQMDSRVIQEVSNIMLGEFTRNLQARLEQSDDASAPVEAKPINAGSAAWQAVRGIFRG